MRLPPDTADRKRKVAVKPWIKWSVPILFALLAGFLFVSLRGPTRLAVEPPTASVVGAAPAADLLSELSIDVSVASEVLRAAIDERLPRSLNGSVDDPTDLLTDDTIDWSLSLGAMELRTRGELLAFSIPFTDGRARLHGRLGLKRRNKGLLGWFEGIAGGPFSESAAFAGEITGTFLPRLTTDWTIDPALTVSVLLDKAEIALFGERLSVSFRGAIQQTIDQEVRGVTERVRRRLANDDRIVGEARRLWDAMHAVVSLSTDPPVWMSWRPTALGAGKPRVTGDSVSMSLGATVASSILVQPNRPDLVHTALPSATAPRGQGTVHLSVPVTIGLDRFAGVRPAEIGLRDDIVLPQGRLSVEKLSIVGRSNTLYLAADVTVDMDWMRELSATLYLSGTPVLDREANQLRLEDIRFDLNTRNALAGVADFLLEPIVVDEIERRSVFGLLEAEEELVSRGQRELDEMVALLPPGLRARLTLNGGKVTSVLAEAGWLVAILEATGQASVEILDLHGLLE